MPNDPLYTCVVKCKVCDTELNRVADIPEEGIPPVSMAAPLTSICAVESHNSAEEVVVRVKRFDSSEDEQSVKSNKNIKLDWYRQVGGELEFEQTIEGSELELS